MKLNFIQIGLGVLTTVAGSPGCPRTLTIKFSFRNTALNE